jgi:hypothetical protein
MRRNSFDWLQQWPIGTGRFGGMVGGTIEEEIIPLTIADYYVSRKMNVKDQHGRYEMKRVEAFHKAREALKNGNVNDADKHISTMRRRHGLGMFQYIGDLALFFSPSRLSFKPQEELETSLRQPKKPV